MSADVLAPPGYLSPKETLAISSRATQILKSLQPGVLALPYPLSLLTNTESPEKWQTYENLLIACLKTGDDKTALQCLEALNARFGSDNERVLALKGLYQEAVARGDAEVQKVLEGYEATLREHPEFMSIRKRRVALLKSIGKTAEAIKALVKILDVSPTDAEAWSELAESYFEIGSFERSVYCWEEALLVMPFAWNVHARVAEVEYIWANGSAEDREKIKLISSSLRRYCRAIELCDDYLRGYYGLHLTSTKLKELLQRNERSAAADVSGDLSPPPLPAVESLRELAIEKLSEIVRRASSKEAGWDGYNEAEIDAARALLGRDTQTVQR